MSLPLWALHTMTLRKEKRNELQKDGKKIRKIYGGALVKRQTVIYDNLKLRTHRIRMLVRSARTKSKPYDVDRGLK